MARKALATLSFLFLFNSCSTESLGPSQAGNSRRERRGFRASTQGGDTAISVRAHRVGKRSISTFIIANTTLESIRDVTIYSKLNAIVSHLYVEEGDRVNKGWLVARLDETEIRNEFDQAQIAVDQAHVALGQAEVKAQLSAASYKRAQSLFEQNLTSQEEFDQAELTNRTDELALENAKQQLEAAKARLEAARIRLEYTKIPSPIQGVITERLVDVGDRVNVNESMFTVQEFPPLWARIYVPEKALSQLNVRQETQIAFEAYPENEFNGRIKMISPTIDAASGTVKVTIEITRPGRLLRPGMFGTVYIATQTHDDAIAIPKKAILRERDLNYVFLIQPDKTV
ncbi:MAG: efflux RND transporter periplasmic adaptor subunit, partial [Acidobacteriota bacterium]